MSRGIDTPRDLMTCVKTVSPELLMKCTRTGESVSPSNCTTTTPRPSPRTASSGAAQKGTAATAFCATTAHAGDAPVRARSWGDESEASRIAALPPNPMDPRDGDTPAEGSRSATTIKVSPTPIPKGVGRM